MKTLNDVLQQDAQMWADATLTPEQYRAVLSGVVPILREPSARSFVPTTIINEPGRRKSRHISVVDLGDGSHGPSGTGGTFDEIDQATKDETVYRFWKNWMVSYLDAETSRGSTEGLDFLANVGQVAAEKVREMENKLLLTELGPVTGITKRSGIQTFSGSSWANAGVAFDDIVTAIDDKLAAKNVPRSQAAIVVNQAQMAKLRKKQVGTANFGTSFEEIEALLPGGVYSHPLIPAGKAYVYARTPTVMEYRVYQDFAVVPLPRTDEDHRGRIRTAAAFHVKKADGIVEITGL